MTWAVWTEEILLRNPECHMLGMSEEPQRLRGGAGVQRGRGGRHMASEAIRRVVPLF